MATAAPLRVLFVGAGATGGRAARVLAADGHRIVALRRSAEPIDPDGAIDVLACDITDPIARPATPLPAVDAVVVCVTAPERTEDAYRSVYVEGVAGLLAAYARQHDGPPRRVVFASSTAVYGDVGGAVVDESTLPEQVRVNGRVMLEAERSVRSCGAREVVVARLGGIYGGGTNRLVARVRAGLEPVGPGQPDPWTNRIHVDDAAAALAFLVTHPAPPEVVNVVDDEPARRSDVVRFLASRLGVGVPEDGEVPRDGVPRDDKRVANARLRALGFVPRYPSYREGYVAVLADAH